MNTGAPPLQARGVDTARLSAWLERTLPQAHGPLGGLERLAGGRSNLTYRLRWGDLQLVLRRPPLGHVLPTAHDMGREYRVLAALAPTAVPVPRPFGRCEDPSVLGAPFYVMELAVGGAYRSDADLAPLDGAAALSTAHAVVDTLAELHAVDPDAVGLAGFGRPEGFMERQVRRWRRQWDASRTREVPGADALNDRLAANCPRPPGSSLVHGDYKLDNLLFAPGAAGRVAAVLDWEMSTLGDPLSDLGMLCMYWDGFAGIARSPVPSPGALPGWPDRAALVDRYARRSTLPLDGLDWYVAFAFYKIAAILEGIHCRTVQGLTVGEESADLARAVPLLVGRGHAVLDALR
ncbi:phosphotransferase family protein [Streptacidiphilus albus]|uniref:phosphotransferase family protein n=1 Tax=Streptacidiphilus albus TaxID=105425 RepID=UPI00054B66CA|nr:phosphotransferase family protein [Streptacidiphilus albus]